MRGGKGIQAIVQMLIILAIIVVVNVISNYYHTQIDLTEDKRYTMTDATVQLIEEQEDVLFVKVLLDGKFPDGFKRLQGATRELLQKFNSINGLIEYEFDDPLGGTTEEDNQRKQELSKDGINPTNLTYKEGDERTQVLVYPYAIINYGERSVIINLLEDQTSARSNEEVLNNSVALLEYKFSDAIQKLKQKDKPNILITKGNGELKEEQLASLTYEMMAFYDMGRIDLDSITHIKKEADLLIIPGAREKVDIKNQFKIDQYVMNGGKVIWLIEKMDVTLQKINEGTFYVPPILDLDLDNLLFKYGVRVQPNLILDLECSKIPQVVGSQGGKVQTELFPWVYHPLIASRSNHPIVKNIGRVNMFFPSTLDTVKTATNLKKTVLLSSSNYSRYQLNPMRLNFEILKYQPDPDKFNKGAQPVAILVEGKFESLFKNRVSQSMEETLKSMGSAFQDISVATKQLFVSDADFVKNLYDVNSSRVKPIGYNQWTDQIYKGNRDFIINAIEYMLDQNGVLASRSKEVKLRLLDKVRAKAEKTKWQLINIALPILLLLIFGLLNFFYRKKKYASETSEV